MKTIIVDANVIIRFLLHDHPSLSKEAKSLFLKAQNRQLQIYFDEVIVAEVVWTLSSFYRIGRKEIAEKLEKMVAQDWVINPRKSQILQALKTFAAYNLDYIDCWIKIVAEKAGYSLSTFDKDLKKSLV